MPARILLFDLDSQAGLGLELGEVLQARFLVSYFDCRAACPDAPLGLRLGELSELRSAAPPKAVFLISSAAGRQQVELAVRRLREEAPDWPLFLATRSHKPRTVMRLLALGVIDFVTAPFTSVDILPRLWRLFGADGRGSGIRSRGKKKLRDKPGLGNLIGESEVFLEAVAKIPQMARSDATVLILGETGTGKEVCARAVHYLSPRSRRPFVPVNCGAIPLELVERELFGHERAAFTGASTPGPGLVHEAEGGTLFLDEVDALPPSAQVKLLRFLQEKEYRPLGSPKTRRADVRVVAATNTKVEDAVAERRLRQDLYYRLAVLPLRLPPLRERREDVLLLARNFLAKYAELHRRGVPALAPDAVPLLYGYDWPGNVRELEHVLERALVFSENRAVIRRSDIVLDVHDPPRPETFRRAKARVVARFEKGYIENLLTAYQGNITRAARAARKNRRAFFELIRKHRIDAERFRAVPSLR